MIISSGIISFKNWVMGIVPALLTGLSIVSVEVLTVFIIIDVMTGILSVARIKGWRSVSSKRFSFGVIFKLLLLIIPFIIVWMGKAIGIDVFFLAVWSLNLLIVSEGLSILGNIQEINTGKEIKEMDVVGMILRKTRKIFLSIIEEKK